MSMLEKGSFIKVIYPASSVDGKEAFKTSLDFFARKGIKVDIGLLAFSKKENSASLDKEKALEIMKAFSDPHIKAIFCGRGGYGSVRLLNLLDFETIRKNKKPFFGASDINTLLLALKKKSGLKGYTGFLMPDISPVVFSSLEKILDYTPQKFKVSLSGATCIKGEIIGSTLSILAGLYGTPYMPSLKGKILAIEDVNEKPYVIDRIMHSLYHAGLFHEIKALVLGQFHSCIHPSFPESKSTLSYLDDFAGKLEIPVVRGLEYGHATKHIVFQQGGWCEITKNCIIVGNQKIK